MLGMDIDTVVPGHGPVTDKAGITTVRDYLAFVDREATERHAAGVDAFEAARDIGRMIRATEDFGELGEFGRIAVNVDAVYRSLDPDHRSADVVEQFRRMGSWTRRLSVRSAERLARLERHQTSSPTAVVCATSSTDRTASTHPIATHTEKMNHWTAYDRCGPSPRAVAAPARAGRALRADRT